LLTQDETEASKLLPWDNRSPLSIAAAILYAGACINSKVGGSSKTLPECPPSVRLLLSHCLPIILLPVSFKCYGMASRV